MSKSGIVPWNDSAETFSSLATQLMSGDHVIVEGKRVPVNRVGSGHLRMVAFKLSGRMFEAIEQNPDKPSNWGKLAREGHQVVQFRDLESHRYVAVSVDGKVTEYSR
jgi:hypothetical protein